MGDVFAEENASNSYIGCTCLGYLVRTTPISSTSYCPDTYSGARTLRIMTLGIKTLSIMTLGIMTLRIITFSIMTHSITIKTRHPAVQQLAVGQVSLIRGVLLFFIMLC